MYYSRCLCDIVFGLYIENYNLCFCIKNYEFIESCWLLKYIPYSQKDFDLAADLSHFFCNKCIDTIEYEQYKDSAYEDIIEIKLNFDYFYNIECKNCKKSLTVLKK